MKKIVLVLLVILANTYAFGQLNKINDLFDKYEDASGITSIKIGKPMFKMLNSLNITDDEDLDKIKPLLKNINSIQILIFTPQPQDSIKGNETVPVNIPNAQNEIYNAVKALHFEELISIVSNGQKIKFLTDNSNEKVLNKLVLSLTGGNQSLLMLLDGKINMDDISKLVNEDN